MVAPVVGPIVKPVVVRTKTSANGVVATVFRKERSGFRQRRPYNLPLPATMTEWKARDGIIDTRSPELIDYQSGAAHSKVWLPNSSPGKSVYQEAYNSAYSRLVNNLNGDAALGINYVQRKQAMSMIGDRALQLYNFSRHLRRLEFAKAADDLNLSRKRLRTMNLKSEAKGFGNNWLEFHFGWSPLIHDIHKAIDLSQNPIPDSFIQGTAKGAGRKLERVYAPGYYTQFFNWDFTVKVKIGTHIYVSNPNLYLANKLGLVNPAIVIWDAVPFSFVVDWFGTLNAVMASWTDFAGLTLVNPWNSTFYRSSYEETWDVKDPWNTYTKKYGCTKTDLSRSLGIGPGPFLKVKKPWTVSSTRAATGISLLLQSLRR